MGRTADEIEAMSLAEKRAAVAVDLLGWVRVGDRHITARILDLPAVTLNFVDDGPGGGLWDLYGENPGGFLGIVYDAMIERGYYPTLTYHDIQHEWIPGYVGGPTDRIGRWEVQDDDRENATLTAVLLALAAEAAAAAKGGA